MYIEKIEHPINRKWCVYCHAEATRRLPAKIFKGTGQVRRFELEVELPVCNRCFEDFSGRLSWNDLYLTAEPIPPQRAAL